MKHVTFASFFLILMVGLSPIQAQHSKDTLSDFILTPKELQEDFRFLKRILTETHPGLYRYSSNEKMDRKMDSLSALLNKPMTFYDFHLLLADLIASIRCAHTYLTPTKNLESYYVNHLKTFPFMIFFIEGKYFVTVNGTNNPSIEPGNELVTINGQAVLDIRAKMKKYLWADGYNEIFKNKAMNEVMFPLFYYLLIERPEVFNLVCKDNNGNKISLSVRAQPLKETLKNFRRNRVNKQILSVAGKRNKLDQKKGWRLDIRKEEAVGVMRITGFGGGENETEARLKMRIFLDGCMKQLSDAKIKDLILDLRYNGGGWDIQGVELFTYLIKEPMRCYRRLHSITDSTEFLKFSDLPPADRRKTKQELKREPDGTFSVQEEFSEQLKVQQPKSNRFKGNVYLLANGGSASTTGEFIAYTKSAHLATIIGEETGSAYEGGNGGTFLHFDLPHSKISVGTPLLFYENEVTPPSQKGRGTLPDFIVPNTMNDILKGYDTQLQFTLNLIKQSRAN